MNPSVLCEVLNDSSSLAFIPFKKQNLNSCICTGGDKIGKLSFQQLSVKMIETGYMYWIEKRMEEWYR
ncbi:hypothetical protein BHE17_15845 [Planococcus maritimus]|nr:hypothetical protein BHE17_15845 [Planococcus maritimus]